MSYLKKCGSKLIDNIYDIVPIKNGFKYPGMSGWQNIKATKKELTRWISNGFSDGGVGILTKYTPAVDIDVHDEGIVKEMVAFAHDLLGPVLLRTGLPPKTLIPCRTDTPFSKMSSKSYMVDGKPNQIEILCDGQQFVAFAIHPQTNKGYSWDDSDSFLDRQAGLSLDESESGKSILNVKHADLPLLTRGEAQMIIDHFHELADEKWGGSDRSVTSSETGKTCSESDEDAALEHYRPPMNISMRELKGRLFKLDPDRDYHLWLNIGMGLSHEFKGSEEGLKIWDAWSSLGDGYKAWEPASKWKGFKPNPKDKDPMTLKKALEAAEKAEQEDSVAEFWRDTGIKEEGSGWEYPEETMANAENIDWLVEGFMESNCTAVLFGDSKSFKSFMAIDLGCRILTGMDWYGHKVKKGSIFYAASEGKKGIGRRMKAWAKRHKFDLTGLQFRTSKKPRNVFDEESAKEMALSIQEEVKKDMEKTGEKISLIIIDTLARSFGSGDENNASDMNIFIDNVNRYLRDFFQCTVLIIHHTGHQNKNRARGSVSLTCGIDIEFRVERLSTDPKDWKIKLVCTKMKDAEEPEDKYFKMEQVPIDFDNGTNSLVPENIPPPVVEEKPLVGIQKAIFDLAIKWANEKGVSKRANIQEEVLKKKVVDTALKFRKNLYQLRDKNLIELSDDKVIIKAGFHEFKYDEIEPKKVK